TPRSRSHSASRARVTNMGGGQSASGSFVTSCVSERVVFGARKLRASVAPPFRHSSRDFVRNRTSALGARRQSDIESIVKRCSRGDAAAWRTRRRVNLAKAQSRRQHGVVLAKAHCCPGKIPRKRR